MLQYRLIRPADDAPLAHIIRTSLQRHGLDIPGTAYFDPELAHLSAYYQQPGRAYFVALGAAGQVCGGVGIAEYGALLHSAELQKLYLAESCRGRGYGRALLQLALDWARTAGYWCIYLETHTQLGAACRLYEAAGFVRLPAPPNAVHGAMNRFYAKAL